MALEAGQYPQAEKLFSMALSEDPRNTLSALASSKVYRDILSDDPSYNPVASLEENSAKAVKALNLLKNKGHCRPEEIDLQVKIF